MMTHQLNLQRRHSKKCPDRERGPDYLKCRGHCPLRICGMMNGRRIRVSLKTRDLRRASRRYAEMQDEAVARPRKELSAAIEAFHGQHARQASETQRKYKRVMGYVGDFCSERSLRYVNQIGVETMD